VSRFLLLGSILLNNKTTQLNYGLVTHSNTSVISHNFLEEDERFDSYLSYSLPKQEDSEEEEDKEEEEDEEEEDETSEASRCNSFTSGHVRFTLFYLSRTLAKTPYRLPPPTPPHQKKSFLSLIKPHCFPLLVSR
jgi:TATA-binding protein-associated factor Taf7